jgi:cytidylate kinase
MNQPIICISRQFGSGGRVIGEQLAKRLHLPFYDRSIIEQAARNTGLSEEFIEREERHFNSSMLFNLAVSGTPATTTGLAMTNRVLEAETEIIKNLAQKGGCVIVGRCADYILQDDPRMFSVFVCADYEWRIDRAINQYALPPERAAKTVRNYDKQRSRHYQFYTDRIWGDKENYHMILNTARLGMDACVELLVQAIENK